MRRVTLPSPRNHGEKAFRGVTEGSAVAAAVDLLTDALVTIQPWFQPRRTALVILLGALVGSAVRVLASRFLWRARG